MSIVMNKEESIELAHKVSTKALIDIVDALKTFDDNGDPAESLYLMCHTIGMLISKACIASENFGAEIYGIDQLNRTVLLDWINEIVKENLGIYGGNIF